MNIYLADLYHVFQAGRNPDTSPYTVPLGIGFLAATVKQYLPGSEVRLFRDPNRLLSAARNKRPELVGFSFSSWNSDLSGRVAERVKNECLGVVTVGGGPSVDDADDQLLAFFESNPMLDYLVPNEGEGGFLELVRALDGGQPREGEIPGVAYLDEPGRLVRGAYRRPVVPTGIAGAERLSPRKVSHASADAVEIPSPYLDGTLDEFLDEGLVPIIQTMRGCPYQCEFCVSGATEWNRMRGFEPDRIKAEIDYALSRSRSKDLIFTDENWGIMGERDVDLARFVMERHKRESTPARLYYYTAKIATQASREIVELVAPIAWIGEFSMSFQSLNPETRRAIKRTNISLDKLAANVQWAQERNIHTASEMIYGFPHETPDTFFDGVERLVEAGMDSVTIYPLQLFPGIDLAAKSARDGNGFYTKFRLADCGYGIYDDGALVAVESEEIIVANRWSTEADYFTVRRYGFFQQAMLGRAYGADIFRLCAELNVPAIRLIRHLASMDYERYPTLAAILADHARDASAELKATREEVYEEVVQRLKAGHEISGVKLNLVYLGRLMSSAVAIAEMLEAISAYFEGALAPSPERDIVLAYVREVLPYRIVLIEQNPRSRVIFRSRFDYPRWIDRDYNDIAEILLPHPAEFAATISPELQQNLSGLDVGASSDLQGIFDKTASRYLFHAISED